MRNGFILILIACFSIAAADELARRDQKAQILIDRVIESLAKANRGESKLSEEVMALPGFSSSKIRHFLNNLCSYPKTKYFEIGCWKGSTLVAALFKNESLIEDAIAMDNWSELGGPKGEFLSNIQLLAPQNALRFFEADCFAVNKRDIFNHPINIYFYDGAHTHKDQELAFTYYDDIFDDVFIAIVDDWNLDAPRVGTNFAFRKLGYKVLFEVSIDTERHGNGNPDTWWDGFYIAVVKKTRTLPKSRF